ncbi:hypothetical protein BDQ12DRAFT_732962 [Crucibulum laeve]|uniref:BZIP domain-containing protein n=1 Tax=Crucibulum laeve TaxID=68775 RepID=A0A5C3MEG6_9AGAR|nr:hypothetical protein BDQ12DRAFT_732962 [Crucibulum laeve]
MMYRKRSETLQPTQQLYDGTTKSESHELHARETAYPLRRATFSPPPPTYITSHSARTPASISSNPRPIDGRARSSSHGNRSSFSHNSFAPHTTTASHGKHPHSAAPSSKLHDTSSRPKILPSRSLSEVTKGYSANISTFWDDDSSTLLEESHSVPSSFHATSARPVAPSSRPAASSSRPIVPSSRPTVSSSNQRTPSPIASSSRVLSQSPDLLDSDSGSSSATEEYVQPMYHHSLLTKSHLERERPEHPNTPEEHRPSNSSFSEDYVRRGTTDDPRPVLPLRRSETVPYVPDFRSSANRPRSYSSAKPYDSHPASNTIAGKSAPPRRIERELQIPQPATQNFSHYRHSEETPRQVNSLTLPPLNPPEMAWDRSRGTLVQSPTSSVDNQHKIRLHPSTDELRQDTPQRYKLVPLQTQFLQPANNEPRSLEQMSSSSDASSSRSFNSFSPYSPSIASPISPRIRYDPVHDQEDRRQSPLAPGNAPHQSTLRASRPIASAPAPRVVNPRKKKKLGGEEQSFPGAGFMSVYRLPTTVIQEDKRSPDPPPAPDSESEDEVDELESEQDDQNPGRVSVLTLTIPSQTQKPTPSTKRETKKRKVGPPEPISAVGDMELTEQEKIEKRRQLNKLAVQETRRRKREHVKNLELKEASLQKELALTKAKVFAMQKALIKMGITPPTFDDE